MKKYLTYRPDGSVLLISDGLVEVAPHLTQKQFTIDEIKERENWVRKVKDDKLVYEKPPQIVNQEKADSIAAVKDAVKAATTVAEVKTEIDKLINLIS